MRPIRRIALVAVTALTLLAIAAGPVAAHGPRISVVKSGLDNPRGIEFGRHGHLLVAETGAGRVIELAHGHKRTLYGGFPVVVGPEGASGVHGVAMDRWGKIFATVGEGPAGSTEAFETLWKIRAKGHAKQVADIGAYQAVDTDPTDVDMPANPAQSNPYGIEITKRGHELIADAGNNDLLLRDNKGRLKTVARFPTEMVKTDHLSSPPPVAEVPSEAVPTAVAIGPDGYWYVGELKGFPFRPGSSNIWRIAPWARNATCDADTSDGCKLWRTGFTAIVGMDFAPDGSLYVVEMVKNGLFSLFEGGDTVGALLKVRKGKPVKEIAAGKITLPGGVVAGRHNVFVTVNSISATDGQVLKIRL
jgi:glucose/arabinose dehydrogenase